MANNIHGNNNEKEISNYLNGKIFEELNSNMKEFIKYICKTKNISCGSKTKIIAKYISDNKLKEDFWITIGGNKIYVSLKMGTGNSVHQETIESFIEFIKLNLKASEVICDLWRLFIWGDGTKNGNAPIIKDKKGNITSRFGAREFKVKYPKERKILQDFLNNNSEALIDRFLFVGNYNSSVDFIYHGTYKSGTWISKNEIIKFIKMKVNSKNQACLSIGFLTIQSWNVSKNGKNERKRGNLQAKFAKLKEFLKQYMKNTSENTGTFLGDMEEYDFSKRLNKNKKDPMWKILLPNKENFENHFVIKVSNNQYSSLSEKEVKTKSDAYVVEVTLDNNFLLSKEFVLDENDIKDFNFKIENKTGISIKLEESKRFTYQKFTIKSFCKAFNKIENIKFWLISLLIYSNEKEIYKNNKILADLGYTMENYKTDVLKHMNIDFDNTKNCWNLIRNFAQKTITKTIKEDDKLAENIFFGTSWFKAPYHANFIYKNGKLTKNKIADFIITTGSGRTHGKYSIEIKPK